MTCPRRSHPPSRRRASTWRWIRPSPSGSPRAGSTCRSRPGPTTPVSPGSILEFGGFDEGFETGEAQPLYLHEDHPVQFIRIAELVQPWCHISSFASRHAAWPGVAKVLDSVAPANARATVYLFSTRISVRPSCAQAVAQRTPGRDAFDDLAVDDEGRGTGDLVFLDARVGALSRSRRHCRPWLQALLIVAAGLRAADRIDRCPSPWRAR